MRDLLTRNHKSCLDGQSRPAGTRRLLIISALTLTAALALIFGRDAVAPAEAAPSDALVAGTEGVQAVSHRRALDAVTGAGASAYQVERRQAQGSKESLPGAQVYPVPALEPVNVRFSKGGELAIDHLPRFTTTFGGRVAGLTPKNEFVYYSIDQDLQQAAERIVKHAKEPHVALVAMEPSTGRVLAIAEKSASIPDLPLHSGFPAASVFKIVTAAAALERGAIVPTSTIRFRGGTYTLNQWNYRPDRRRDRRQMTVTEALARSCNPVFGRIGLQFLSSDILRRYIRNFGFNSDLGFDAPLPASEATVDDDDLHVSLTSAGFGEVHLSPVHAATMISGIANGGLMPRPILVDRVVSGSGEIVYQAQPGNIGRIVQPATAQRLLQMMESTTTIGTSRKQFFHKGRPVLPGFSVAAKTGTLRGDDPQGINNWFVAAAPIERPRIAISVIVVDPTHISTKASQLGRELLQSYLAKK